jgi:hypothetical protein
MWGVYSVLWANGGESPPGGTDGNWKAPRTAVLAGCGYPEVECWSIWNCGV